MSRIVFLLLLLIVFLAFGSQVFAETSNDFLFGFGTRSLGMGGAFASLADDPLAVLYNPAGLGMYQTPGISGEYKFLSRKVESGLATAILWEPVYDGLVGVGYFGVSAREKIREGSNFRGVSNRSRNQGFVSYGRQMGAYSLGTSLKITRWTNYDESTTETGLDLGFLYPIKPGLLFGSVFRNAVHSESDFDYFCVSIPRTLTSGVSVVQSYPDENWNVTGVAELEWMIDDQSAKLHMGGELTRILSNDFWLAGRLGFNGRKPAMGAGIGWTWVRADISVTELEDIDLYDDWAFTFSISLSPRPFLKWLTRWHSAFRNKVQQTKSHNYNASESAIAPTDKEVVISELSKDENNDKPVKSDSSSSPESIADILEHAELFSRVNQYHQRREYQTALDILSLILKIDPGNQAALNKIIEIREGRELEIVFELALGDKLEKEGQLVKALSAYNRVRLLDSSNLKAQTGIKRVERKLGAPQKSAQGVLAYSVGKYKQAKDWFELALQDDPQEPVALEYMKKLNGPLPTSLNDIKADSVSWQWYLEGLEFNRNREYQKAIEAWLRVLQVHPNCSEIRESVADAKIRLQQTE